MFLRAGIVISLAAIGVSGLAQPAPDSQAQPARSLAHFRRGEEFVRQRNFQSAANEFNEATKRDGQPAWTFVWSLIDLGRVFDATGQRDRAVNEYQMALDTGDDTFGAQGIAAMYLLKAATLNEVSPLPGDADSVIGPAVLSRVEPAYSAEALLARLEGTVSIVVSVAEDGSINDIQVFRPLGLGLDEAAINAVRRWKFAPGTVQGQAASAVTLIEVPFRLPSRAPGWRVTKIQFQQPDGASRPVLIRADPFSPIKMGPELAEEATIDAAMSRIPNVTVSMEIDSFGNPSKIGFDKVALSMWGEDAIRAVSEWRFRPGKRGDAAIAVPCVMELAWFAPQQ